MKEAEHPSPESMDYTPSVYRYSFWSLCFGLALGWLIIGIFSVLISFLLYPFTGSHITIQGLEAAIIAIVTIYIARKLAQQPVFELTADGLWQGSVFLPYSQFARIEQSKRLCLHIIYIFKAGEKNPTISIFWPKHIIEIDSAIAAINSKTGWKIALE